MLRRFGWIPAFLLLTGGLLDRMPALAEPQLDIALVVAVDISSSMEAEEQGLQRTGFAEAFRSTLVHEAIRNGAAGRIAVTYVEWSGAKDQTVLVPWTIIDGPEKAIAFADRLAGKPIRQAGMTSISGIIDFSRDLFKELGGMSARRVIDISGDGPNNDGRKVVLARDEALADGIVINGLPIMFGRTQSSREMDGLDVYYKECVIGGAGSFMIPLHDPEQFAMVIRTKIMREIAGIGDDDMHVIPARSRMNCVSGEMRTDDDLSVEKDP
ncbi:DUF1194 domain-containing protein [Microvirga makkahensis]|uniref:DUF1194 domain-containing protein n=1 Tax=Microvirga makkahensis TaxID=1128670 RepID=A0A7X3MNF6_9HYPH|nr:DUF1194 domain-containing protein [Microvirga makkahensis]MXQ10207.1 DUF1194 domain-containing protein [Microvirga makkahensis]